MKREEFDAIRTKIEEIRDRVDTDNEGMNYPLTLDVYDLADCVLALWDYARELEGLHERDEFYIKQLLALSTGAPPFDG